MLRGCSALTAQLLGGPLHAAPAAALANAATRAARRAYAADMVPTASKEEQAQEQQQKQQAPGDSEWTEVVDQGTGEQQRRAVRGASRAPVVVPSFGSGCCLRQRCVPCATSALPSQKTVQPPLDCWLSGTPQLAEWHGLRARSGARQRGKSSRPRRAGAPISTIAAACSPTRCLFSPLCPPAPGQTYFWNESTGETTQLGEPRPKTRFRDQGWSGAGDPRFQEGWREPPGKDLTYFYSLMGIAIGIGAGWATRFFH